MTLIRHLRVVEKLVFLVPGFFWQKVPVPGDTDAVSGDKDAMLPEDIIRFSAQFIKKFHLWRLSS